MIPYVFFLFHNVETDGSFLVVMLPKIMLRFLAANNLLHEHDGKAMNILTKQMFNCAVVLRLDDLSVI